MPTIASAILLCLPGLLAPPPHLRVDITIEGVSAPPAFVTAAIEEAADIWAAYGVDIRMAGANDAEHDRAVRLAVTLASTKRRMETGALGSIVFSDDAPEPAIKLYPAAASTLIAAVASSRRENTWPAGPRGPGPRACSGTGSGARDRTLPPALQESFESRAHESRADRDATSWLPIIVVSLCRPDEVRRLRSNLPAAKG